MCKLNKPGELRNALQAATLQSFLTESWCPIDWPKTSEIVH